MLSLVRTRALFAPCIAGVALICCAAAPAAAQSVPSPAPSASPISQIGHVVTSDRQDEPVTAGARTTYVVTKSQMLQQGDTDVASAIASVPGVLVQRNGGAGALATVSILGALSDGVLVLLDGRPIAGGQTGTIDLGSLPTAGVERIEVVENAGSTLYGANASAGVINIITARSASAYQIPLVSLAGGSYGYGRAALETANFSFSREISNNDYPISYASPALAPGTTQANAGLSSTNARFTDAGTFGNFSISGSAGFVSRILGVPGPVSFQTFFARQADDQQDARIDFALHGAQSTTSLDLSGSRETLTYQDPSAAEYGPFLDFTTDARVQANLRDNVVSATNRLVYGLDLAHGVARNDAGNGDFSADPYAQTGLYAQDNLSLGAASSIYAGLRGERDGAAGAALTPALGGILGLGGGLALRVNAGTAFEVPSAEDLYYPGYSNPYLQPERTQNFDATIADANILGGASIGWFVQTGTNLIVNNPNASYLEPYGPGNEPLINQPQSSIANVVLSLASKPLAGFTATGSVTDTYRALGFQDGFSASRLLDRPVFATALNVAYDGAPESMLASVGAGEHTVGLLATSGGTAGDYTTIDAFVRLRAAKHALVSFRVFDLGNKLYEEVAGYPMPGRTFTLELSTR